VTNLVTSNEATSNEATSNAPTSNAVTGRGRDELKARAMYAKLTEANPRHWRIVARGKMVPGRWYYFCDLATGQYGRCRLMPEAGTGWHQEARGTNPTILEYRGGRMQTPWMTYLA